MAGDNQTTRCEPSGDARFRRGRHWLIRTSPLCTERQDVVWHPGLQSWGHIHTPATAAAAGWKYERPFDDTPDQRGDKLDYLEGQDEEHRAAYVRNASHD